MVETLLWRIAPSTEGGDLANPRPAPEVGRSRPLMPNIGVSERRSRTPRGPCYLARRPRSEPGRLAEPDDQGYGNLSRRSDQGDCNESRGVDGEEQSQSETQRPRARIFQDVAPTASLTHRTVTQRPRAADQIHGKPPGTGGNQRWGVSYAIQPLGIARPIGYRHLLISSINRLSAASQS